MPPGGLPPDQILNAALAAFLNAVDGDFPLILIWGARFLDSMILLGLGWAMLQSVGSRDWMAFLMSAGYSVLKIALIQGVMVNIHWLGPMFGELGTTVGANVSGQSPNVLTPSGFYSLGLNIISMLIAARHFGSWFNLIADAEFVLLIIATQVTWFAAAVIYLWTLFEVEWYWITGPLVICFSPFEHTWESFISWFAQMLRSGLKLAATLVILAIGLIVANQWTNWLSGVGVAINSNQIEYGAIELVEALILFYAVWTQPARLVANIVARGAGHSPHEGAGAAAMFALGSNAAQKGARAGVELATGHGSTMKILRQF